MNKDQLTVGNCPHCKKVIFKDGAFNSEATFFMRCPHCQKFLKVTIIRRIEVIVSPAIHQEHKNQLGANHIVIFLILVLPVVMSIVTDTIDITDIFC